MPPTLQQATADWCLHQRLLDTHGQVWVILLWGHCSFLLGPGSYKFLFVPSKSLFPQSCVSSGGSMVGLMATSYNSAYVIPRSTAPRAPAPAAVHCWPVPLRRHPNTVLSQSLWGTGSWCIQDMFEPSGRCAVCFWRWFCPSYHLAGAYPLPLALDYLLKGDTAATPAWHSCLSNAYRLAGASLPVNVGYLLTVAPVLHSCWIIYQVLSILSLEGFLFVCLFVLVQNKCKAFMTFIVLYYYLTWCYFHRVCKCSMIFLESLYLWFLPQTPRSKN